MDYTKCLSVIYLLFSLAIETTIFSSSSRDNVSLSDLSNSGNEDRKNVNENEGYCHFVDLNERLVELCNSIYTTAEQIMELVTHGADVNTVHECDRTPLHTACQCGNEIVVNVLLTIEGIKVNVVDEFGLTPLHLACRGNNDNIVKALATIQGIDMNAVTWMKNTPLHYACVSGNDKIVNVLLAVEGIDVNALDYMCYTPLHFACQHGLKEIVRLLLAVRGIDVTVVNNRGKTPFESTQNRIIRKMIEKHSQPSHGHI